MPCTNQIDRSLTNACWSAAIFFDDDTDFEKRRNNHGCYPGTAIVEAYTDNLEIAGHPLDRKLPNPSPTYCVDAASLMDKRAKRFRFRCRFYVMSQQLYLLA